MMFVIRSRWKEMATRLRRKGKPGSVMRSRVRAAKTLLPQQRAAPQFARLLRRCSLLTVTDQPAQFPNHDGSVVAAAIANRWMRWLFHQVQNPNLAA